MTEYFLEPKSFGGRAKVELDLFNYAAKVNLKNGTGIDISKFITKCLKSLKSKVDKIDVDKLVPVPVYLSKLSDVVINDVVKKDAYNANIKHQRY